jgi:8-oxo-dGTP diphosphatase
MTDVTPTYVVNVEAAIHRDGEYLLAERADAEEHAAGQLSLVGGKVEASGETEAPLERTVKREIREEVGLETTDLAYVTSSGFVADDRSPVVNVVFRAEYDGGTARPREPDEVAAVHWRTPEAIAESDAIPEFTREYVELAEADRRSRV